MSLHPDYQIVICNMSESCIKHKEILQRSGDSHGCGGAEPHLKRGCDPCPFDPTAKCIPVCPICKIRPGLFDGECRECHADH